jgi:serine phosphatase RsbU (regulator of sigma subunit)
MSTFAYAQVFSEDEQYEIDNYNKSLSDLNSHDTTVAKAYVGLSEILHISNFDTLNDMCQNAIAIAENKISQSSTKEEQIAYLKVLGGAYNNVGYYYDNKGNIEKGLLYYHKSLKIEEYTNNKFGLATILNNIALLYYRQGAKEKSLEYHFRSLKLREEIDDKEGVGISLSNIGYYYDMEGDYETGLDYYFKSLEIQKSIDDKVGIAYSYNNIGYVFKLKGETKKSLKYHLQGLKIQKQINDKRGMSFNLFNISQLYFESNEIAKAKKYAMLALTNAKELGMPDLIASASEILSDIYEKENNPAKALEYIKLFMVMEDSIHNEEVQLLTAEQQAKYLYEKQKVVDDAENEKLKILNNAEHEKEIAIEKQGRFLQTIIIVIIGIGLLLVIGFLIFVFNRLRVTNRQKEIIENQKELVELSHNELEVKNKEILDSIKYAKRIQSAILPADKEVSSHLDDSFILYLPKDIVAGDFYWIEKRENKVLFAAADCTGHGVPGAMVSVVCNNALNRSVREHLLTNPADILNKTREIVISEFAKSDEDVKDGMDIALCTIEGLKLEYAGANSPLWIIRNNELIEIKPNKQPIGMFEMAKPFTGHQVDLVKGDLVYVFTDGYSDQFGGEKGKKFKSKALRELLLSMQNVAMPEQKKVLNSTFNEWKGEIEQIDDVCIFGVKV